MADVCVALTRWLEGCSVPRNDAELDRSVIISDTTTHVFRHLILNISQIYSTCLQFVSMCILAKVIKKLRTDILFVVSPLLECGLFASPSLLHLIGDAELMLRTWEKKWGFHTSTPRSTLRPHSVTTQHEPLLFD